MSVSIFVAWIICWTILYSFAASVFDMSPWTTDSCFSKRTSTYSCFTLLSRTITAKRTLNISSTLISKIAPHVTTIATICLSFCYTCSSWTYLIWTTSFCNLSTIIFYSLRIKTRSRTIVCTLSTRSTLSTIRSTTRVTLIIDTGINHISATISSITIGVTIEFTIRHTTGDHWSHSTCRIRWQSVSCWSCSYIRTQHTHQHWTNNKE